MNTKKPLEITTADLVLPDLIVNVSDSPELQRLVDKYGLKNVAKRALSKEEFEKFAPIVDELYKAGKVKVEPGGSSANMLVTLIKLLGRDNVHVNYFGVVGNDEYVKVAQKSLTDVGITLLPNPSTYQDKNPQSARSFVLQYPEGGSTTITYPGNARDILKPEMITDDIIKKSNVVFALGSVWQRFAEGFADRLVTQRWNHRHDNSNGDNKDNGNGNNKKELWIALPTNAKFGEDNAKGFQFILPSTDLTFSNIKELSGVYKANPEKPDVALKALQQTFINGQEGMKQEDHPKRQVAFITLSEKGAVGATKDGIVHVPVREIKKEEIVNEVGAGDTSFAGFAAGYINGLPHAISAEIAMALANQKLRVNKARLDDPRAALREASPKLADQLLGREREPHLIGAGTGIGRY